MTIAYYNEHDIYAAQWLRNLIAAGHIAPGIVDERDIRDVTPAELIGFDQCHFFAGIGIWSHALRRAGWPDDRQIWTGSCPCQPFSAAGRAGGFADERHLWPHWHWLIEQCKPAVVVGEQVASKDGLAWLDLVQADMEGTGYAIGASDLCAAGFSGAHIRQRLYFVGLDDRPSARHDWAVEGAESLARDETRLRVPSEGRGFERLDDDDDTGPQGHAGHDGPARREGPERPVAEAGVSGRLGNAREPTGQRGAGSVSRTQAPIDGERFDEHGGFADRPEHAGQGVDRLADGSTGGRGEERSNAGGQSLGNREEGWPPRPSSGGSDSRPPAPMLGRNLADWLFCRDGKWRPVEPGTQPLAYAAPARVGRLRAYGNGLDAETATNFCEVVKEIVG